MGRRSEKAPRYSGLGVNESHNLAHMYGYSLKFMKWIVDVYLNKCQK